MPEPEVDQAEQIAPDGYWAIVELMGHVRVAGLLTEAEQFGAKMGRLEVPRPDGGFTTQFFGGSSVYRITPTTEEVARHIALASQPRPVNAWELPQRASSTETYDADGYPEGDDL